MKNHFLKLSILFAITVGMISCEKVDIVPGDDVIGDSTITKTSNDSIVNAKLKINSAVNPEVFLGIWRLDYVYYNDKNYSGDSTLWLFHKITFTIVPSTYGCTSADIERVESKKTTYYVHCGYWKTTYRDVIFYDFYYPNSYNNLNNTHFSLLNYKVTNTTLECDVWDHSGPDYKYSRLMHCVYSKVKDY